MQIANDIPHDQRIKVIFKGFVIAELDPGKAAAAIGALASSPCHAPKVNAYQFNQDTGEIVNEFHTFKPADGFSIVTNKQVKAIAKFQKDRKKFNRFDRRNDRNDLRWFVNLNDVHDLDPASSTIVKLKAKAIGSAFTFDDGLIHSSELSDGDARRLRLDNNGSEVSDDAFGKFALEITLRIYLANTEKAEFFNGKNLVFTAGASQYRYEIWYDCRCLIQEEHSDFPLIYDAIDLPTGVMKANLIRDDDLVQASPEVYCTGGFLP
jgi:hypothetical protein